MPKTIEVDPAEYEALLSLERGLRSVMSMSQQRRIGAQTLAALDAIRARRAAKCTCRVVEERMCGELNTIDLGCPKHGQKDDR